MKNACRFLSIALLSLALPLVHAQNPLGQPWSINVPFNFSVRNVNLAAGQYSVQQSGANGLIIRSAEGKGIALMASPDYANQISTKSSLVFLRNGDEYALKQVWVRGSSTYLEMPGQKHHRRQNVEKPSGTLTSEVRIDASNQISGN